MAASENNKQSIYSDIGTCIMAWARIELALLKLFEQEITRGTRRSNATAAAQNVWGRVISFDTKLKILDGVLEAVLTKETQKALWRLMYNRAKRMAGKRNEIAHGRIMTSTTDASLQPYASVWPPRHTAISSREIII